MATTAFTGVAQAQTAPQQTPEAATPPVAVAPATAPATAPAAPQPAPLAQAAPKPAPKPKATAAAATTPAAQPTDFGVVTAAEPQRPRPNVALAQPGFTSSPADFAAAQDKAAARAPAGPAAAAAAPTAAAVGAAKGGVAGTADGRSPGGVTRQDPGGGYIIPEQATKSRSTVTRDAIDKLPPTANPYQAIALLPGIVVASSDNNGLNGGNVRIRGFNSDHVGFTIEGAPVNDSGNYALYPQEYVDAENIGQISVAQGSPDLDSPHIGSAGGVINLYMRDPSKTAGGYADFSIGSNHEHRQFVRGETGQIGAFRAFLSESRYTVDHFASPGHDDRSHIDFKGVLDINKDNAIRLSVIYNEAINNFYPNPTLAQYNTPGYDPGYLSSLPSSFFNTTPGTINQSANSASNYYGYRINPFKNLIISAPSNFKLTENLKFDTTPYYWYGFGNGGGVTALSDKGVFYGNLKITNVDWAGSGNKTTDTALYYNPSITQTNRPGIVNKFTYKADEKNDIVFGNWFELARHRQTGTFEALNGDGGVLDPYGQANVVSLPSTAVCQVYNAATKTVGTTVNCPTGPLEKRDQLTQTMTNMVFVGDTYRATQKLSFDVGVRQTIVNRDVQSYLPGANPQDLKLNDYATLPTAGLKYKENKENETFASVNTSFRSIPNYALVQGVSFTSGAVTPALTSPPERGVVLEAGHRYQGPLIVSSISGFYGHYDNFQVSSNIPDPAGSGSTVNVTVNAGTIINYGVDAELGLRPINNFRPYVSGELLRTQMQSNITTATTTGATDQLATKGKQLVGAPNFQLGIGLDYDDDHFFGNVNYKYLGAQFSTFVNDEKLNGFGRVNAAIGYRFDNFGFLKRPEIKLNLSNLLNTHELTGVSGFQNNAQNSTGVNGGTIAGSAPSYYVGQGFSGMLTFSSGF